MLPTHLKAHLDSCQMCLRFLNVISVPLSTAGERVKIDCFEILVAISKIEYYFQNFSSGLKKAFHKFPGITSMDHFYLSRVLPKREKIAIIFYNCQISRHWPTSV